MIFRKSWTTFVSNFAATFAWIALAAFILVRRRDWAAALIQDGIDASLVGWLFTLALVFIAYRVIARIWRFFWLRSFTITVGDDLVTVRYGILPWTKFQRSWDGDQMHECLMESSGFTNWLLRTGDLIIVGSEGSTREYRMRSIGNINVACGAINQMRREARQKLRV